MWGTKSRFVDVFISKIGWNPGNEFGNNTKKTKLRKHPLHIDFDPQNPFFTAALNQDQLYGLRLPSPGSLSLLFG